MLLLRAGTVDPWRLEIIVVRAGSHSSGERAKVSRDVHRGLLLRLGHGGYVDRTAFESMSPEERHVVRMRALAALSDVPVLFSHFSAAVALGLPVLRERLGRVHVTTATTAGTTAGVARHSFTVHSEEVVRLHDLLVTSTARTVVDVAGTGTFSEGVMAADAALHGGIARDLLELAIDLAGARQAFRRMSDAVAFAHPGAESAIEPRGRVTMLRIGVEPPELQRRFLLPSGVRAHPDFWFPTANAAAEADGDVKYLDPGMAPDGWRAALRAEKQREDELRSLLDGLARFGWRQAGDASLLRPVLARAGVNPARSRPLVSDYARAAADALPRQFAP